MSASALFLRGLLFGILISLSAPQIAQGGSMDLFQKGLQSVLNQTALVDPHRATRAQFFATLLVTSPEIVELYIAEVRRIASAPRLSEVSLSRGQRHFLALTPEVLERTIPELIKKHREAKASELLAEAHRLTNDYAVALREMVETQQTLSHWGPMRDVKRDFDRLRLLDRRVVQVEFKEEARMRLSSHELEEAERELDLEIYGDMDDFDQRLAESHNNGCVVPLISVKPVVPLTNVKPYRKD